MTQSSCLKSKGEVQLLGKEGKLLIEDNDGWMQTFKQDIVDLKTHLDFSIAEYQGKIEVFIRKGSFKKLCNLHFAEPALNMDNSFYIDLQLGNEYETEYQLRFVKIPFSGDFPIEVYGLSKHFLRLLMITMRRENAKLMIGCSTLLDDKTNCMALVSSMWDTKMFFGQNLKMNLKKGIETNEKLKLQLENLPDEDVEDLVDFTSWNGTAGSCLRLIKMTIEKK